MVILIFYLKYMTETDVNVCSCPCYTVTIDPSKDTEKYIADDEAVWSSIKLLACIGTFVYTDGRYGSSGGDVVSLIVHLLQIFSP